MQFYECNPDIHPLTNTNITPDPYSVPRIGPRIHRMKKLFNNRDAWQPKDDWLPERLLSEKLPTGVGAGIGLSPDELRQMIQSHCQARGWDENGFVPENS